MTDPEALSAALRQLHLMVDSILFGDADWPPDPDRLHCRLSELALIETLPDSPRTYRYTELGTAAQVTLFSVFLGIWDESGVPLILEPLGLLSRADCELLWDRLEAGEDMWSWLKARLRTAFRLHFGQMRISLH